MYCYKEELNIDVKPDELKYIKTLKRPSKDKKVFINNEFDDLYILITNKDIKEIKYQEDEISEILFVTYKRFKEMIVNNNPELLMKYDEFEILFQLFDEKFGK